jgi:hypothetical protein
MSKLERIQPEVLPYIKRMALVHQLWSQNAPPICEQEGARLLEVFADPQVMVFVDKNHSHFPTFRIFRKHKRQAELCFAVPICLLAERTYNQFIKQIATPANQELLQFYENQKVRY